MTPKSIDALRPATGKRYEVHDVLLPGLHIRVSKTGGKVFCVTKRVRGRAKRITIGRYPIVSLHEAREKARVIMRAVEADEFVDESIAKARRVPTLGEIVPQFIELYARPRNKDWRETDRLLLKFKPLFSRPIDEIKRIDVVRVLDAVVITTLRSLT